MPFWKTVVPTWRGPPRSRAAADDAGARACLWCPPGDLAGPSGVVLTLPSDLPALGDVVLEEFLHLGGEVRVFPTRSISQLAARLEKFRFVDPTFESQPSATES